MRPSILALALSVAACSPSSVTGRAAATPDAGTAFASPTAAGAQAPLCAWREAAAPDGGKVIEPCPVGEGDELQRAIGFYDRGEFVKALACAVQAAAAEPESAPAQAERAAALSALGRLEEARLGFARTLALDPDHVDGLLGAADLYLNRLNSSRDALELGLAYARRGHARARKNGDKGLAAEFAVLEATALNGLGRNREALARASEALGASAEAPRAHEERGVAHWELCEFAAARKEFEKLVDDPDLRARARYHLGLIAEFEGDEAAARTQLALAGSLSDEYAHPMEVSAADFARMVSQAVAGLPADMRRDLEGVPVSAADLPDLEDLTIPDPPLSPEILGLFRGPPMDEDCTEADGDPCRSIVVYRKNLQRAVRDRAELEEQVRATLVHEIGHLRGENDLQLVARGLE